MSNWILYLALPQHLSGASKVTSNLSTLPRIFAIFPLIVPDSNYQRAGLSELRWEHRT
jgi:hypothetical protein